MHTVNEILFDCLREAEQKFGPRDNSFSFIGIEFVEELNPSLYFPSPKTILIKLMKNCELDLPQAVLQLSHEVIHCLSPTNIPTVIEEGLATFFSIDYVKRNFSTNIDGAPEQYLRAAKLVNDLF